MDWWDDPDVNPFGLKLVDDPRKSVPVIIAAKVLAHFNDAAGVSFVCVSIGGEKRSFKASPSGYEAVEDVGIRFVIGRMTDELLSRRR